MPPRSRFSLSWQILLAAVLGIIAGLVMSGARDTSILVLITGEAVRVLGSVFLVGAHLLAVPMIVAGGVEALVGLESMRGLRRLAWKAGVCFLGACVLAAILGWGLIGVLHWNLPLENLRPASLNLWGHAFPQRTRALEPSAPVFLWPALLALGIGLGFYRNQIGEGRSHLLLRFWRGVDDAASLFVAWARRIVPLGVLCTACSATAKIGVSFLLDGEALTLLGAVVACWAVYALGVLPAMLWLTTRTNPWKYARAWMPVILAAWGTASLTAALPLGLEAARRRTGVSQRIGDVMVPLGAAVWRDGAVLGWTALAMGGAIVSPSHPGSVDLAMVAAAVAAAVVIGGGPAAGGPVWLLNHIVSCYARGGINESTVLIFGVVISAGGAAVSQWSAACATAIIAHWEGERGLLTPKPPEDPLFGERLSKDFI